MITVATCGCFDLLHAGHISYLQESRKLGDKLVVLLNTDEWIRQNKREPIYCQEQRKFMLEALSCVDQVILFNSNDEKEDLLRVLKPQIFTKATKQGEYNNPLQLIEAPVLHEWNGSIILIESIYPKCSTSETIKKIVNSSVDSVV